MLGPTIAATSLRLVELGVVEVGDGHSEVRTVGVIDEAKVIELRELGERLVDGAGDERGEDGIATSGGAAVPIYAPDGHVIGAVVAATSAGVSSDELGLLRDTAATIELDIQFRQMSRSFAAQIAADQVENAVESSLAEVATATSRSWTTADVARAVAMHGEAATGAAMVSLATIESESLRFHHGDGVSEDVARSWVVSPLSAPIPMAACVDTVEPIILRDRAAFDSWPVFRDAAIELEIESFMALPIVDPNGAVLASLGIGWSDPLEDGEISVTIARLVSITMQALRRATEHENAQDHMSVLESIVLPGRLPIAPGLEIHGRYQAPLFSQRVGGDLFDAWVRDDGAVALVIADVSGHNLLATRTTAALRHSIGMLSLEMREPSHILQAVNRYVQNSEASKLATCCYCVIDVANETMTIANAGHPQPRVRSSDGSVTAVGPVGEMLLGFGDDVYSQQTIPFLRGSSLVMFTDGLTDRRSADLLVAERTLDRQIAQTDGMTASEISALLLASLGDEREDDVAVMVVRRPDIESGERHSLMLRWPRAHVKLSEARAELRTWLDREDYVLGPTSLDDILLVATELLSNARTAAVPGSEVVLACDVRHGRVEISVRNEGAAFSHRPTMPIERSPRGRGLAIIASLADLSVDSVSDLVTVRAVMWNSRR